MVDQIQCGMGGMEPFWCRPQAVCELSVTVGIDLYQAPRTSCLSHIQFLYIQVQHANEQV